MIVDATGLVLGRLASVAAKSLLAGEDVLIVNAEKVIITGGRVSIYSDYGRSRARGTREKGPYFPRRPDRILKRTIRGMLPYKLRRGRDAMSRLRVYVGVPRDLANGPFVQPEAAKSRHMGRMYVELGELSKRLGANF